MEHYDPGQNVCQNQDDYNQAFRNAIQYNNQQNINDAKPWMWVYFALYLIFFVWALMLAMRVPYGPERTLHLTLALVAAPAYVLAYYLGVMKY